MAQADDLDIRAQARAASHRSISMARRHDDRYRRVSLVGAACAVLLGAAASVLGASAVADGHDDEAQRQLEADAASIVNDLGQVIVHELDLLAGSAAVVLSEPATTSAQLTTWADEANLASRYPEVSTLAYVDTSCHVRAVGHSAPGAASLPTGDLCRGDMGPALQAAIDSGTGVYALDSDTTGGDLAIVQSLIPGPDARVSDARERWDAHAGWMVMVMRPEVVVGQLTAARDDTSVAIIHSGANGTTIARAGTAPGPTRTIRHLLGGEWTVAITRTFEPVGLFEAGAPAAVLTGGLAGSVLLGVLIAMGGSLAAIAARLRARTSELLIQATRDGLTGLANRDEIREEIRRRIEANTEIGGATGVIHVDVDDFKAINDSLGHSAGDDLLRAAAARLSGCMRDSDVIARVGGDEFIVVLGGAVDEPTTQSVASRLLEVMRAPFHLPGARSPVRTTVTIGAAVCEGRTAEEALQDADVALHHAKASGKNSIHVFHPQLAELQKLRFEMQLGMTAALAEDQFRLVYQPIWKTDARQLVGVEALLRWEHPTLGLLPPDQFIPELEANGHIVEVGRWVLGEACRQVAEWQQVMPNLTVSVNASARQFTDDQIIHDVRSAMDGSGIAPGTLTIEITETALMADPSISAGRLQRLRDLGCHIAIDDFGVGYSSLGYLQMFPADVLKIDRSFVTGLSRAPESLALVRAIVQLASDLHLHTLAEGVETEDQLAVLRDHQVKLAQGYLVAKPLTPADFVEQMLGGQRQRAEPTRTSPATS
jgi:diguanylate cyclase (GGDEF)-like protein